MKTPRHLKHKPILTVDDYNEIDGPLPENETDAQALSIGKAQWNNKLFSAKVFRNVKGRWSRQSEELPLHRVLDLANLVLSIYIKDKGNYQQSTMLKEKIVDLEGYDEIKKYIKDDDYLKERIRELKNTIKKISKTLL